MSWFRVPDTFWNNPSVRRCSLSAIGLWTAAGSWAAHQVTGGWIPEHIPATFGADLADAAQLVEAGLWIEKAGGWQGVEIEEVVFRATGDGKARTVCTGCGRDVALRTTDRRPQRHRHPLGGYCEEGERA